MHRTLDWADTTREPHGIPLPVSGLREPHGIGHEDFEVHLAAQLRASKHGLLGRLVAPGIEVQVVGENRVGDARRDRRPELLEDEPVQPVAALIDVARVAPHECRRDLDGLARRDARAEIDPVADAEGQESVVADRCSDAAKPAELPPDVQALTLALLYGEPRHGAGAIFGAAHQVEGEAGQDGISEHTSLSGGVAAAPPDPPRLGAGPDGERR